LTPDEISSRPDLCHILSKWNRHLEMVQPDDAGRELFNDFQSYSLTGLRKLPWVFVNISVQEATQSNAKSSTKDVIKSFNGTYAVILPAQALMEPKGTVSASRNGHTAELNAITNGTRVAIVSETPSDAVLCSKTIKDLTESHISLRKLHREFETVDICAKTQVYTNFALKIDCSKPEEMGPVVKRHAGVNWVAEFFPTQTDLDVAIARGRKNVYLADSSLEDTFKSDSGLDVIGSYYSHRLQEIVRHLAVNKAHTSDAPMMTLSMKLSMHPSDTCDEAARMANAIRTYMQDTHKPYRDRWLAGYLARIDFCQGFFEQIRWEDTERDKVPPTEDVFESAFEILKATHDYVPRDETWKSVRRRLISHLKEVHGKTNVSDLCKRYQGERILLIHPVEGSDWASAFQEAAENHRLDQQRRGILTTWSVGDRK
jgi:hypothetical protein